MFTYTMARQQKLSQSGQSYKLLRNEDTVFALRMPRPLHGLDDKYMKIAVVPIRHEEVCFLDI